MEVAGFCEPARGVGGDYYDFINFDNSQLGLAIADVAGKGMPAALLMSTVQATLRSLTARNGTSSSGEFRVVVDREQAQSPAVQLHQRRTLRHFLLRNL